MVIPNSLALYSAVACTGCATMALSLTRGPLLGRPILVPVAGVIPAIMPFRGRESWDDTPTSRRLPRQLALVTRRALPVATLAVVKEVCNRTRPSNGPIVGGVPAAPGSPRVGHLPRAIGKLNGRLRPGHHRVEARWRRSLTWACLVKIRYIVEIEHR